MRNMNWNAVIANVLISAITAEIITSINIKLLYKKFIELKSDIIEGCTDEVARFIKNKLNNY